MKVQPILVDEELAKVKLIFIRFAVENFEAAVPVYVIFVVEVLEAKCCLDGLS